MKTVKDKNPSGSRLMPTDHINVTEATTAQANQIKRSLWGLALRNLTSWPEDSQRVIDAVLDSPKYGEDVKRYAKLARQVYNETAKYINEGDLATAVCLAFSLGERVRLLSIIEADSDAMRGAKLLKKAQEGHAEVHGTKKEKATRWSQYQIEFDRIIAVNPKLKKTPACNLVAERFTKRTGKSVVGKTVSNHIIDSRDK